jgi:hypothetical protein
MVNANKHIQQFTAPTSSRGTPTTNKSLPSSIPKIDYLKPNVRPDLHYTPTPSLKSLNSKQQSQRDRQTRDSVYQHTKNEAQKLVSDYLNI